MRGDFFCIAPDKTISTSTIEEGLVRGFGPRKNSGIGMTKCEHVNVDGGEQLSQQSLQQHNDDDVDDRRRDIFKIAPDKTNSTVVIGIGTTGNALVNGGRGSNCRSVRCSSTIMSSTTGRVATFSRLFPTRQTLQ